MQPPHETDLMVGPRQALPSNPSRRRGNATVLSLSCHHRAPPAVSDKASLLSTALVSSALGASSGGVVLEGALGVGAEVLERVLGRVLGLLGAAGDALVVGVVGGCAGLGTGLALGLGGLAALVGGGHFCGCWGLRLRLGWVPEG